VEELHFPARKNFPFRRVIVYDGYDDLWQATVVEMRPYTRFNKGCQYVFTVIDVLNKNAWAMLFENKKWNWDGYSDRKDNSRWWKMFEKFANQYGKRILQCKRTNTLVKTQHKSLFNIMKASVVKRLSSTVRWKTICGNNLRTMEIMNGSTCYRV